MTDAVDAYSVWFQGQQKMRGPVECRYPAWLELEMMKYGYEIRLNGRKLTRKEVKGRGN